MIKLLCLWVFTFLVISLAGLKNATAQVTIRDSVVITQSKIDSSGFLISFFERLLGKRDRTEKIGRSGFKKQINEPVTLDLSTLEADSIITIQPGPQEGKDAYVSSFNPNFTFQEEVIGVAYGLHNINTTEYTEIDRTFIEFQLPQIAGYSLIKAALHLYEFPHPEPVLGENEFLLNRVVSDWREGTITWNNQPAVANSIEGLDYVEGARTSSGFFETILDVTEMAQYWIDNPQENFGIGLRLQFEDLQGLVQLQTFPEVRAKLVAWFSSDAELWGYSENLEPKLMLYLKNDVNHFDVTVIPASIDHDSTATLLVQAKDSTGNNLTLPDATLLDFTLDDNGQLYGNLVAPDGSQADSLAGITYGDARAGNVKYIANGQVPDSTAQILVTVTKSDEANFKGSGSLTILQNLDHFLVTVDPDTIAHENTAAVTVQAKDVNNTNITIPDSTLIGFSLDANGRLLGNLVDPDGSQGQSLAGITYGNARTGQVKYVANGDFPNSTQQVGITVSKSDDASKNGTGSLAVQCHILPPRYAQNGGNWGSVIYDNTTSTIAALGCALSSETYVMTAFGDVIDPGELNTWMNNRTPLQGGYVGSSVNWTAMEKHSPGKMTIAYTRKQMETSGGQVDSTEISDPLILDDALTECKLIIVQVYNEDTGNEHWVSVTGKEGGRYTIVDPGKNEKYLDGYGAFWSYLVVTKL